MSIEISVPFRINAGGGIATTSDPEEVVALHVRALVGTQPGVRVMRPEYGVDSYGLLFDPDDELTNSILRTRAEKAFAIYEPGVNLVAIGVNPSDTDGEQGLKVDYTRKTDTDTGNQKTNQAVAYVGGRVVENIRG